MNIENSTNENSLTSPILFDPEVMAVLMGKYI